MPIPYQTLDHLPDLSPVGKDYAGLSTQLLKWGPNSGPFQTNWDALAIYGRSNAPNITNKFMSFYLIEGARYDMYAESYFNPGGITVYDQAGNAFQHMTHMAPMEQGTVILPTFTAPYTGLYYAYVDFNTGSAPQNQFHTFIVASDVDTIAGGAGNVGRPMPPPQRGQNADFLFNPTYYLADNPDLARYLSKTEASGHYRTLGASEGRDPTPWFDADYYEAKWPDLSGLGLSDATLFAHFNLYGVWEGRSPGPVMDQFDGERYLEENPDVAAYVNGNVGEFLGSVSNGAIAHFIIYGDNEGRQAFDLVGQPIDLGY